MADSKLAYFGGEKTVKKDFPWPVYSDKEKKLLTKVIESGEWGKSSNPDNNVAKFENAFASYIGVKHAVAMVNGSVALRLSLLALGAKPGDEVILPPMTFIATASIVVEANCIPVFVDIDRNTYNIDPDKIEDAITSRTRAIIPVHFGGHACEMDKIISVAKRHDIDVIEDACHAHGAEYKGIKLGSIGDAGCFSFQSSKNLTCGEGGIVVTNNDALFEMIKSLHNCGRKTEREWYEHFNLGCNYRMTQFQAAILLCQLERLEEQTVRRNENGLYLNELLKEVDGITPLRSGSEITLHSYHLYPFRYDKTKFQNLHKSKFALLLAAEGVPCFMGYPEPIYRQPVFQEKNFLSYVMPENVNYSDIHCPECEKACYEEGMWISQNALLGTKTDMKSFVTAIKKIQNERVEF
jgi:dTDP-4-amino-4,6-dideoxygalactose transaminase